MPMFLLQIVGGEPPHPLIRLPGGRDLEHDLVETCTRHICAEAVSNLLKARRYGWFAPLEADMARILGGAVEAGLKGAIADLKADSRYAIK